MLGTTIKNTTKTPLVGFIVWFYSRKREKSIITLTPGPALSSVRQVQRSSQYSDIPSLLFFSIIAGGKRGLDITPHIKEKEGSIFRAAVLRETERRCIQGEFLGFDKEES